MSNFFNDGGELVVITAHIFGPTSNTIVRLALDTGSVGTVIHPKILTAVGYDISQGSEFVSIVTASGIMNAPRLVLSRIIALGQVRGDFTVTCHALPTATNVEGLLGLDFCRQQRRLIVDFQDGEVILE